MTVWIRWVWGGAWGLVFLTSSRGMLMLSVCDHIWGARRQTKPNFLLGLFSFWKLLRLCLMTFFSFHANTHPSPDPRQSHKYSHIFFNNLAVFKKPIPKPSEDFTSFVIWLLSFA